MKTSIKTLSMGLLCQLLGLQVYATPVHTPHFLTNSSQYAGFYSWVSTTIKLTQWERFTFYSDNSCQTQVGNSVLTDSGSITPLTYPGGVTYKLSSAAFCYFANQAQSGLCSQSSPVAALGIIMLDITGNPHSEFNNQPACFQISCISGYSCTGNTTNNSMPKF